MSNERDQIRSMAERIARRLSAGEEERKRTGAPASADSGDGEVASLRAHLAELQERLAHLEAHVGHEPAPARDTAGAGRAQPKRESAASASAASASSRQTPARSNWLSGTYVPVTEAHPSEERFGIQEAVSELVDFFEREKICSVEPGEKP